jgi:hypothetical protein
MNPIVKTISENGECFVNVLMATVFLPCANILPTINRWFHTDKIHGNYHDLRVLSRIKYTDLVDRYLLEQPSGESLDVSLIIESLTYFNSYVCFLNNCCSRNQLTSEDRFGETLLRFCDYIFHRNVRSINFIIELVFSRPILESRSNTTTVFSHLTSSSEFYMQGLDYEKQFFHVFQQNIDVWYEKNGVIIPLQRPHIVGNKIIRSMYNRENRDRIRKYVMPYYDFDDTFIRLLIRMINTEKKNDPIHFLLQLYQLLNNESLEEYYQFGVDISPERETQTDDDRTRDRKFLVDYFNSLLTDCEIDIISSTSSRPVYDSVTRSYVKYHYTIHFNPISPIYQQSLIPTTTESRKETINDDQLIASIMKELSGE